MAAIETGREGEPHVGFCFSRSGAGRLKDCAPTADTVRVAQHHVTGTIPDKGTPVVRRVRKATGLPPGVGRVTEGVSGVPPRQGVIAWVSSTGTAASGRCRVAGWGHRAQRLHVGPDRSLSIIALLSRRDARRWARYAVWVRQRGQPEGETFN